MLRTDAGGSGWLTEITFSRRSSHARASVVPVRGQRRRSLLQVMGCNLTSGLSRSSDKQPAKIFDGAI